MFLLPFSAPFLLQPAYHSSLNEACVDGSVRIACGMGILPLRTAARGPAPAAGEGELDIIDEALNFFRANVFFSTFDFQGAADRTLVMLTVFISECIIKAARTKSKDDGTKLLYGLGVEKNFAIPGEKGWYLGGHMPDPQTREEADLIRGYMRQCREEICGRIQDKLWNADGSANKWWMMFSKRQFMGVSACVREPRGGWVRETAKRRGKPASVKPERADSDSLLQPRQAARSGDLDGNSELFSRSLRLSHSLATKATFYR